jgi:O-antigen ligase
MRKIFAGLAILLMLVVVAQFYLAASGAFSTAPNDESFRPHRVLGYVIFFLPVLMTIVGALARLPGRLVGMAGLVAGLTVVQMVIAQVAKAFGDTDDSTTAGQLVFGLHAVNGLAILAVVGMIVRQARTLSRTALSHRRVGIGGDPRASRSAAGSSQPTP